MRRTRIPNVLMLTLASSAVLAIHWGILVRLGILSWSSYVMTVAPLEQLERLGLPTLTGSDSGWPLPTALGLALAIPAWMLLYATVMAAAAWLLEALRFRRATPTGS